MFLSLARLSLRQVREALGMIGLSRRLWPVVVSACACAVLISLGLAPRAQAQDRRHDTPGEFDFYVLALSWSPTFCEAAAERGKSGRSDQIQCGGRPFSFVVHGLWPQYERGFPEYCQRPSPRLDRRIMNSMLDLMPAPGLIYNEWDKHGTCTGLSQRAYFEEVRKARAAVRIPPDFIDAKDSRIVTPAEVEAAFIKANPGLSSDAIAVSCDSTRLSEVRICMARDLQFQACGEIDRRACRRERLEVPPVRGG
jgi:ribonuclease T2